MNKIIGIRGSNLAKNLFVKALSEKTSVIQYNRKTYDFLCEINVLDESKEDYPSWLITEMEHQNFSSVIVTDDLCPNSLDLNWVEGYYINLTDGSSENIDGETYDVTINVKDKENLSNKLNILLR